MSINCSAIYRPVSGFGLLDVLPPEVALLEVELLDEEEERYQTYFLNPIDEADLSEAM